MSLRVKSLIAAFLLVVGVTATLSFINEGLFADSVGKIIEDELRVSANTLMHSAQMSADKASNALNLLTREGRFVLNTVNRREGKGNKYREIADNFQPFMSDWLKATDFDVSLVFYDSFVASDRKLKPTVLATYEELTACAFRTVDELETATKKSKSFRSRIFDDQYFQKFINDSYGEILDDVKEVKLRRVIAVDNNVYLVVVTPLVDSLQENSPVGMAVVMKVLSVKWANEQLKVVNNKDSVNKLQLIVHADNRALSHTLESEDLATSLLSETRGSNEGLYKLALNDKAPTYIANLKPFASADGPGLLLFKNFDKQLDLVLSNVRRQVIWVAIVLAVLGVIGAYYLANTAVTRVNKLAALALKVRDGDFSQRVELKGSDELTRLGEAFNDMNKGLNALGLYTDPALALGVVQGDLQIEADEVEGSIYFSDIADFTSISEQLDSKQLVEQLNEYFSAMGEAIKRTDGYLDKFIGDSIMAFWGKPLYTGEDYALKACEAALACKNMEDVLEQKWKAENKVMFYQRIGIATGECVVGNIGSKDKKNFTVIGDYVNLASRLEGANKFYGTRILLDAATADMASATYLVREIDQIYLKGKSISMRVYELVASLSTASKEQTVVVERYSLALSHYRKRDFEAAITILIDLLKISADDKPALWLKSTCMLLNSKLPESTWEPITLASGK